MDYSSVVFRELTHESLRRINRYRQEEVERIATDQLERQTARDGDNDECHLINNLSEDDSMAHKQTPVEALAVGQALPRILKHKFPPELIGKPIEEIDPYYRGEHAFVVISRNGTIYRFSSTRACFIFSPFNCIRRLAIHILTHSLFSTLVMLTILTNCIFMTLKNVPETVEYVFTVIYTVEAVIKCVAQGFILEKYTFLRDAWNWLDFTVIMFAYVAFFVNLGKFAVLRTFRVLRALKTVAVVPGLKTIVNALIQSIISLRDIVVLSSFILSIFALVGIQLYMGVLRQKCVPTYASFLKRSSFLSNGFNISFVSYQKQMDNETYWYKSNDIYLLCGNASGSTKCPDGYVCWKDRGSSPDFGYTSFDNFGWAMLSCFRLMTQDYWENLYQLVLSAAGRLHFLYFVTVIFFGSFYLVNLVLAIVSKSYLEQQIKVKAENEEREKLKIETALELKNEGRREDSHDRAGFDIEDEQNVKKQDLNNVQPLQPFPSTFRVDKSGLIWADITPTDATEIPLFDQTEQNSPEEERKSQPRSNSSHISEQRRHNNPSTVTPDGQCAPTTERVPSQKLDRTSARSEKELDPSHDMHDMNLIVSDLEATNTYGRRLMKCLRVYCYQWTCESSAFRKFQAVVAFFILDAFADLFITICITLNILLMALDHPSQSETMARVLTTGNYVLTTIFAAESMLKIVALAPARFLQNGWNAFDLFIVTVSLIELSLSNIKGLSVLRSFRLLRVFKLAKSWQTFNRLVLIIGKSLEALGNLTLVLVIIIFIFAVMGTQLFGQKYADKFGADMPRWHFFDFFHTFMIVFRVLCGEWIESMWVCLECAGWPCIPFFLFTFIIGNLVVLNLFLALLLASFGSDVFSDKEEDDNKITEAVDRIQRFYRLMIDCILRSFRRKTPRHERVRIESDGTESLPTAAQQLDAEMHSLTLHKLEQPSELLLVTNIVAKTHEEIEMHQMNTISPTFHSSSSVDQIPPDCCAKVISKHFDPCAACLPKSIQEQWKNLRCLAYRLVEHRFFEWCIIATILASSATLALDDIHTRQQPIFSKVLSIFDKIFTIIFTIELIIKWFAYGIRNYFKNGWNRLDFFIVLISVVGLTLEWLDITDIPAFKAMRTLRALRPLRALSRFEAIRVVVNALFGAIPAIFNVLLVCLVFWLIFSIMGVQLLGGKFYKCVYSGTHDRVNVSENVTNKTDCLTKSFTWENSRINFDNVLSGYLALFQVATFKGWTEIMADATDAKEIDVQPEYETNVYILLYFVLFIVFGSFFSLNLFIGVVIDNFNQQKRILKEGAIEMFMTETQKKYYNTMKKLANRKPTKALPRPRFAVARFLFDLTTNQKFEIFVMVFIFLNMLCMCLEHYNQSGTFNLILGYINSFFVAIFTIECLMKMIALNFKYFTIPWNVFDFSIVVASLLEQTLGEIMAQFLVNPTLLRVFRVVRVGRILRLVKGAKGIRTLLFSLTVSMPALFNIGLLLFLVMFIYSIFGMSFFAYVRKSAGITDLFNFETFPNSMIVLFQMCTTAGWSSVLQALTHDRPPDCDPTISSPSHKGDCGDTAIAIPFLVSFVIITSLVVVNMYIAVILENFSQAQEDVQQGLTDDDYDMYYEKWQRLDPSGSQFIRYDQLSDFLDGLEPPLRIPKPNQLLLAAMNLPICEHDRMHCVDILDGLTKNSLGQLDLQIASLEVDAPMDIKKDRPKDYHPVTTTLQRQRELHLSRMGFKGFRANVERRRNIH